MYELALDDRSLFTTHVAPYEWRQPSLSCPFAKATASVRSSEVKLIAETRLPLPLTRNSSIYVVLVLAFAPVQYDQVLE